MKKILLLFLVTFLFSKCLAQEEQFILPVNMEYISTEISDVNSVNYYPKLMKRFNDFDATLTILDYRFLYYGFTEQPNYSGYKAHAFENQIHEILVKSDEFKDDDLKKIEIQLNEVLKDNPFNLKMLRILIYVSGLLNKKVETEQLNLRYAGIIDAIFSSGDGFNCTSGFKVISVSDEYIILDIIGLHPIGQKLVDGPCDLLYIDDPNNELKIEGLYFDINLFYGKFFQNSLYLK